MEKIMNAKTAENTIANINNSKIKNSKCNFNVNGERLYAKNKDINFSPEQIFVTDKIKLEVVGDAYVIEAIGGYEGTLKVESSEEFKKFIHLIPDHHFNCSKEIKN